MYHLCLKDKFNASHFFLGVRSSDANMHGHTWRVEVLYESSALDGMGEFPRRKDLRKGLTLTLMDLDFSCLNSILQGPEGKNEDNPTSENAARWIYNKLKEEVKKTGVRLTTVIVSDAEDLWVSYSG
jgi:6-pyruvoyltetrahydropterin/6-carboxytetrahydropterin synthase